jgi:hypothetical protein
MQRFEITLNTGGLNVGVVSDSFTDLYFLTMEEANELLSCVKSVLDGGTCSHTLVHRIEAGSGNLYNVLLAVSDKCTRAYVTNKRKLIELKIELMGALDG